MKKLFVLSILVSISIISCKGDNSSINILATNQWTAAYVEAATGQDCPALAPLDLIHPPEYELTPGDFKKISSTETLVIAGYEAMVPKIRENKLLDEEHILQIETGYSYPMLEKNIRTLASYFQTEEVAEKNLQDIRTVMEENKSSILSEGSAPTAVVHQFQVALAKELGFEVLGVFGPAPLQASDIEKMAALNPQVIVDNGHNPLGEMLVEILPGSDYIKWVNFPGIEGTESLADVIQWNADQFRESLN